MLDYRGSVEDNYVSFAGFTWRIVRINGDGSIRLILNNNIAQEQRDGEYIYKNSALAEIDGDISEPFEKNDGLLQYQSDATPLYMYGSGSSYSSLLQNVNSSIVKEYLDVFYEEYILDYDSCLADTMFCSDKSLASGYSEENYDRNAYYSAYERLSNGGKGPTLECAKGATNTYSRYTSNSSTTIKGVKVNSDLKYPIALLSADELVYAGAFIGASNITYYLSEAYGWWTLTPIIFKGNNYGEGKAFVGNSFVSLYDSNVYLEFSYNVRPVINLKGGIEISGGNGTSGSPYILREVS